MECPLCKHPRNLELTNAILKGEIKISEVMEIVGIDDRDVVTVHLKDHIRILSSDNGVVAVQYTEIDSVGVLTGLVANLNEISTKLFETVDLKGDMLDTTNLRLLNNTAGNIAKLLRTLGEFTGDITTGVKVELALQTTFMTKFQNFLMGNMCEEDRTKIVEWLRKTVE